MQDNLINYEKGIRFECKGSGNCCVSRDSYGFVYLSDIDIKRFAKFFNLSINEFKTKYCKITDGFIHLIEKSELNGKCIFLKHNKCSVYKSRPTQCRTWPFWNENMNAKVWNKDISVNCPGVGEGKLFRKNEIDKLIKKDLDNEKSIQRKRIIPQK